MAEKHLDSGQTNLDCFVHLRVELARSLVQRVLQDCHNNREWVRDSVPQRQGKALRNLPVRNLEGKKESLIERTLN